MKISETRGPIFIAVDLGAGSGRVIAAAVCDGQIQLEDIHRFDNPGTDLPGGSYWNLIGLYREIVEGLRKSVTRFGNRITSLGIDTWGCDFGFLNQNGELLGMPHQYRDQRFEGMAELMHGVLPEASIYFQTGVKTNFYNTSLHLLAASRSSRAILEQATSLLFVPDLLAYWLTGVIAVERTIASTSQLLDPRTGDWAWGVIDALELPRHLFGNLVAPGTALGRVRQAVSKEVGGANIPVIATACHDTAAAVAGIPLTDSNNLWLSSGTWSIMGVETDQPITSEEALQHGFCNELGINNSVRFLKNISGLWMIQECKRQWDLEGEPLDYAELAALATHATPFFAWVDPDDPVFATPGDMPARIRASCKLTGQSEPVDKGQILRVVTESLALKYRLVLENIQQLTGRKFTQLNAGGGGIRIVDAVHRKCTRNSGGCRSR